MRSAVLVPTLMLGLAAVWPHRSSLGFEGESIPLGSAGVSDGRPSGALAAPDVLVEVEEEVYQFVPPNNGAGPMWSRGSTCLVRWGSRIFASGLETIADIPPLNNCRWFLFMREDGIPWRKLWADQQGRTREPCPLVVLQEGVVLLSGNPTLTSPEARSGPAQPDVWIFSAENPHQEPYRMVPTWQGTPPFTEHSYRSFAADGPAGQWILFQNIGYTHAEWTFYVRDSHVRSGRLEWPFGREYPRPQPIRVCYPLVVLKQGAVHFCGVSDILEPYPEWREYKRNLTGGSWDYDFRRLFYTWCDNIAEEEFQPWVEISSRDKTAGWITPCDMWVFSPEEVHILWTERAIDERLRPKFFPEEKQSYQLCWAKVAQGKILWRKAILRAEEGQLIEFPGMARFHHTPDGRLFVIFYVSGRRADGSVVEENRIVELSRDGGISRPHVIPLVSPLNNFFTATPRAGCLPDWRLDMLGTSPRHPNTIRYARLRILPPER